jgi:hypothetical protein
MEGGGLNLREAERPEPMAHLGGRLLREGHHERLLRVDGIRCRRVGDPVADHPGLARSSAGEDDDRPAGGLRGLALLVVEGCQDRLGFHVPMVVGRAYRAINAQRLDANLVGLAGNELARAARIGPFLPIRPTRLA